VTRDPPELRAFAERYTAAWCSMDPAAVAAHYAPEGSTHTGSVELSSSGRSRYGRGEHGARAVAR
jgi:hypothetical protein